MPESRHRRRRTRGRGTPSSRRSSAPATPNRPRRRKTNWLYVVASGLIAVLVIGGFAVGSISFGQRGVGNTDAYVEGVGTPQPIMPTGPSGLHSHVPDTETVEYSTFPPTSGNHWARWSNCGFFEEAVPDERIVHNLEHGNVVVSYNLTSEQEVQRLREIVGDIGTFHNWGVARFYDKIEPGTVALSAWGVLDTMQGIDEERIRRFFEAYAGNTLGPEHVPCTQGGTMDR